MKLIILILANDNDLYLQMQKLWKIYMNNFSSVKSYFIKYEKDLCKDVMLVNDTIFINGEESIIPGCLDKTIKSIDFLLENDDYDFIFRTNMSSVINIPKLYQLINSTKELHNYSGVICNCYGINYVSGAGILMSKKICQDLTNNKQKLNYDLMDDVSIGKYLETITSFNDLTRFEAYNYENNISLITNELIKDYYHFRCKTDNPENSIKLMEHIINIIYVNN